MQYPVDLQVHHCERKRHLNFSEIDHLYNKRDGKKIIKRKTQKTSVKLPFQINYAIRVCAIKANKEMTWCNLLYKRLLYCSRSLADGLTGEHSY